MKGKLIFIVLVVAFLFRFVSVSNFPIGLNADEASFGYDAYSILKTGRDQWGNFMPIVLKSFGDNKSPVYAYLTIPSVAVFGLNIFAIRLPSVIIGTLAVFAVYLLVKKLSKSETIGLVSAILLAINPWGIMLSRGAAEANLITFFLPLGIYYFLTGLEKPKYFTWAALILGLNLFTYHSAKLITPIVLISLFFIFRKKLLKIKFSNLIIPISVVLLFFGGFLYTFKLGGGSRIAERSILQGALEEGAETKIRLIQSGQNPLVAKLFHNKYQVVFSRFVNNYQQYFSSKFLFTDGAGNASYVMIPGSGVINLIEAFLIIGLVPLLLMKKEYRVLISSIIVWLLVSPLPAALSTGGGFSGNRASGMVPALQILASFGTLGWYVFLEKVNRKTYIPALTVGILITLLGVYRFTNNYFKIYPASYERQMLFGSLEVMEWLSKNGINRNIIVSRSISEPQIFVAVASKLDPSIYQKATSTWGFDKSKLTWVDQLPSYSLENYTFKSIDWKKDDLSNSLVVVRADEYNGSQIPVKKINYSDGTPNIYVIDSSKKIYANVN
jgi:4-amino-4-deoxy-L-arabinose transferase-like glycosyltransferase